MLGVNGGSGGGGWTLITEGSVSASSNKNKYQSLASSIASLEGYDEIKLVVEHSGLTCENTTKYDYAITTYVRIGSKTTPLRANFTVLKYETTTMPAGKYTAVFPIGSVSGSGSFDIAVRGVYLAEADLSGNRYPALTTLFSEGELGFGFSGQVNVTGSLSYKLYAR